MGLMESGAFAKERVDLFRSFWRAIRVQCLVSDFPKSGVPWVRVDLGRCPQDDWSVRPGQKDALAADDEDLVGVEPAGYRPDSLDKVFKSSDG
jgi:hypothetical protein